MSRPVLLVLGLALVALTMPVQAVARCYTTSTPLATIPDESGMAKGDIYVNNDLCQLNSVNPCVYSVWVYQESNGVPGEQRGDSSVNDVARCTEGPVADTILQ